MRNIIKKIDYNYYAYDMSGKMVKSAPYIIGNDCYFFGSNGKADISEG